MSSNNNGPYGYGIDIALLFDKDGEVDLIVDETGDLAIVGGDGNTEMTVKVQMVIQQIKIRLATPIGTLFDGNGDIVPIGSNLHLLVGTKYTESNVLLIKNYIIMALADLATLESIFDIKLFVDNPTEPTLVKSQIFFKIRDDDNIYYTTVNIVNTGS